MPKPRPRLFDANAVAKLNAMTDRKAAGGHHEWVDRFGKHQAFEGLLHPFWVALEAIWPPPLAVALWKPTGNRTEAELLIQFLEEDPFFFRSGYAKQVAIQRLKKFELTASQRDRVTQVCLDKVDGEFRREFRDYIRLAFQFVPPDVLLPQLVARLESPDPGVRIRATWMLCKLARSWQNLKRPEFKSVDCKKVLGRNF